MKEKIPEREKQLLGRVMLPAKKWELGTLETGGSGYQAGRDVQGVKQ